MVPLDRVPDSKTLTTRDFHVAKQYQTTSVSCASGLCLSCAVVNQIGSFLTHLCFRHCAFAWPSKVRSRGVTFACCFFGADTVPPRVNLALSVDSTQVAQQVIDGQLRTVVVWGSRDPCPGYMVSILPLFQIAPAP